MQHGPAKALQGPDTGVEQAGDSKSAQDLSSQVLPHGAQRSADTADLAGQGPSPSHTVMSHASAQTQDDASPSVAASQCGESLDMPLSEAEQCLHAASERVTDFLQQGDIARHVMELPAGSPHTEAIMSIIQEMVITSQQGEVLRRVQQQLAPPPPGQPVRGWHDTVEETGAGMDEGGPPGI